MKGNQLLAEHRLLTLTGTGGCGKTRLALRVASELPADEWDGIWLVEFAPLSEQHLVPQAIAAVLDVRETAGQTPGEALIRHLQSREVLLVFDNCEHLVTAVAQISAALLEKCPGVRILATSREPLGVPGEAVMVVPPLSLPDPQPWRGPGSELDILGAYQKAEAVQLFVARAAAASPDFRLTVQNSPWVADICRRLDGIPLAIELAAARSRAFSVRQIAEHLDDRLNLLTNPLRTVPPRHQTLNAALDWSYQLLSPGEQILLRRLSAFANGWTLEAAEEVCFEPGTEVAPAGVAAEECCSDTRAGGDNPSFANAWSQVMADLSNLVDKSLVSVDSFQGRKRYRLLETIRHYAYQKLAKSGEVEQVRDRHLEFFLCWAEKNSRNLVGPDQTTWLESFDAEYDNIRSALERSQTDPALAAYGLRLSVACGQYWRLRSYLHEGRSRLSRVLNLAGNQDGSLARGWALLWSASLAYLQSDFSTVSSQAEEGLAICRSLGPAGRSGVAKALDLLGELATEVGDYNTAPGLFQEALQIYRELGHMRGSADMLLQLGWAAMRAGDYARAEALLNESLPLFRELDTSDMLALVLAGLGELAVRQNRFDAAVRLLEESLALRSELGDRWGIAVVLGSLGWAALLQRDFDRMREQLAESLAMRMEIGDRGGIAWCLERLAEAAALQVQGLPQKHRQQAASKAVRVFAAAAALRVSVSAAMDPADRPNYERILSGLRSMQGEEAFAADWKEGETTPLPTVAELALTPVETASLSGNQVDKAKFGGLSPRERKTALLIAQGKTNREIAEAMTVGVKTVETYITRILSKLGFDSRVQVATWAIEVGLTEREAADS